MDSENYLDSGVSKSHSQPPPCPHNPNTSPKAFPSLSLASLSLSPSFPLTSPHLPLIFSCPCPLLLSIAGHQTRRPRHPAAGPRTAGSETAVSGIAARAPLGQTMYTPGVLLLHAGIGFLYFCISVICVFLYFLISLIVYFCS